MGAEEASSARAIGGGLSPKEAVAWELFSPVHRTLVVAVAAAASASSKKNSEICRLRKSVELRVSNFDLFIVGFFSTCFFVWLSSRKLGFDRLG